MKIRNYLLAFVLGSTLAFAKDINFDVVGEVFDYGPQTTKIILKFDEQINPKTLDTQTFKVLTQDLKDRNITTIDFIDHNNVILNLEHGQNIKDANLLYWNDQKFSNVVIPTNYTLIQTKDMTLENGKTIKKDTYKYYMKSLKIKDVDKFTAGEMYGLKYRDFKPQKDGNKHPLIIWLHGAGEGGDSNITQILGNRGGVAFVEEDAQKIFDTPYVLAPQTPTFWMKSFFVGKRELVGEKDYTPDLVNLIKTYIRENPEIDKNRIYIGGCSMGGYQTFKTLVYAPDLFAAAFITCPAYMPSTEELNTVKDTPIWLVHASDDTTVPVSNSRESFKYLKSIGTDVVYTEYKDVVIDGNKYDPHGSYFYTLHNSPINDNGINIFQWIASKKRY